MTIQRHIAFTKLIKAEGRLREFNFRRKAGQRLPAERDRAIGDENPVGGLHCTPPRIVRTPGEPHFVAINRQRAAHAVDEQIIGSGGSSRRFMSACFRVGVLVHSEAINSIHSCTAHQRMSNGCDSTRS